MDDIILDQDRRKKSISNYSCATQDTHELFHNFQLATLLVQVHLEAPAVAPTFLSLTVSALVGSTDTPLLATVVPETAFSVHMLNIIRLFLLFQRPLPIIEK